MSEQEHIPDTMRAIHLPPRGLYNQDTHPSSSILYSSTYPTPRPSSTQYLLQIHTAALSPHEPSPRHHSKSLIPAHSICGTVISTPAADMACARGPRFKIGDEVMGLLDPGRDGGAADYCVAEEGELAFKPRNLSAKEAAGVPLGGLGAWQGLEAAGVRSSLIEEAEDEAEVEGGDEDGESGDGLHGDERVRVLVINAGSEVGMYAIQLLRSKTGPFDGGLRGKKRRGSRRRGHGRYEAFWICGACSARDEAFVRDDLGVDDAIVLESPHGDGNKVSQTFSERGWAPVDVVLDCDGIAAKPASSSSSPLSSPDVVSQDGGVIVKINLPEWFIKVTDLAENHDKDGTQGVKSHPFAIQPNRIQLAEIGEVVENGEMKPIIDQVFGLYEAREAIEKEGGKKVRGNIVLRVNN